MPAKDKYVLLVLIMTCKITKTEIKESWMAVVNKEAYPNWKQGLNGYFTLQVAGKELSGWQEAGTLWRDV